MTRFNRRQFLRHSRAVGIGTASLLILSDARSARRHRRMTSSCWLLSVAADVPEV